MITVFRDLIMNQFGGAHSQGNRFRPSRIFRVPRVVSHPYTERPTDAVRAQKILARTLETKEFPVERSVMRVTEHRTNAVH